MRRYREDEDGGFFFSTRSCTEQPSHTHPRDKKAEARVASSIDNGAAEIPHGPSSSLEEDVAAAAAALEPELQFQEEQGYASSVFRQTAATASMNSEELERDADSVLESVLAAGKIPHEWTSVYDKQMRAALVGAAKRLGRNAQVHWHLGLLNLRAQRYQEARESFEIARTILLEKITEIEAGSSVPQIQRTGASNVFLEAQRARPKAFRGAPGAARVGSSSGGARTNPLPGMRGRTRTMAAANVLDDQTDELPVRYRTLLAQIDHHLAQAASFGVDMSSDKIEPQRNRSGSSGRMAASSQSQGIQEQERLLLDAMRMDPDQYGIWNTLGLLHLLEGDPESAKMIFLEILESHPHYLDALNNLALAELIVGNLTEANATVQEVLMRDRTHTEALVNYGCVLLKADLAEQARVPLYEALRQCARHMVPVLAANAVQDEADGEATNSAKGDNAHDIDLTDTCVTDRKLLFSMAHLHTCRALAHVPLSDLLRGHAGLWSALATLHTSLGEWDLAERCALAAERSARSPHEHMRYEVHFLSVKARRMMITKTTGSTTLATEQLPSQLNDQEPTTLHGQYGQRNKRRRCEQHNGEGQDESEDEQDSRATRSGASSDRTVDEDEDDEREEDFAARSGSAKGDEQDREAEQLHPAGPLAPAFASPEFDMRHLEAVITRLRYIGLTSKSSSAFATLGMVLRLRHELCGDDWGGNRSFGAEAAERFVESLERDRSNFSSFVQLALLQISAGEYQSAYDIAIEATKVKKTSVAAWNAFSVAAQLLDSPDEAEYAYHQAMQLCKSNALRVHSGDAFSSGGDSSPYMSGAIRSSGSALEQRPIAQGPEEDLNTMAWLAVAALWNNLANLYRQKGPDHYKQAQDAYERSLLAGGESAVMRNNMALLHIARGYLYFAEQELTASLKLDPTLDCARSNLLKLRAYRAQNLDTAGEVADGAATEAGDGSAFAAASSAKVLPRVPSEN
ncbi:hypothetical protein FVE85_6119 [Porphyridium purpureum]|uniref:Uncharacterized protein n=1 Tax=Porphyridium purpureum TaxID=35688 RepID=A0A5J4Z6C1_PORPP|nr:hypothetical protein FVE85_6119 [Porphyridium purpureum]|eukprot:POR2573..scf295_1